MIGRTMALATTLSCASASVAAPERATTQARLKASTRKHAHLERPDDATKWPAYRYGQLSRRECEAELVRRKISFVRERARGVRSPVRLTGPLRGIVFRTNLPDKKRATTPWEIADCALILAMHDFSKILVRHGIVEVRHYSMYRPPAKSWSLEKIATRHPGAVALDAARFIRKDGSYLDVAEHFDGKIGAKTCGDGAREGATREARALRQIICETADARLFNVILTPNYNRAHYNHFHLEVTRDVKWFMVD